MVWEEWARITRFVESGRFTLMQAAQRWSELNKLNPLEARVELELQGTLYRVTLDQHIAALRDMWCLYSSALVLYYALAETAAAERLGRDDLVGCNGIEDWAEQLLASAGAVWRSDTDRLEVVEVGVVRNLIAHGERQYSKRAVAKLAAAGMSPTPAVGDRVVLDYSTFKKYRTRLRSLLNRGGLGTSPV